MAEEPTLFQRLFRGKSSLTAQKTPANGHNESMCSLGIEGQAGLKSGAYGNLLLSVGKAEQYKSCPQKFYLANIRRAARPKAALTPHLVLDQALHDSLAMFYRKNKAARPQNPNELLNRFWNKSLFGSTDEESKFRCDAEEALSRYFELFAKESVNCAEIDYFFKIRLLETDLCGKIDRADILPDGSIEVISYKTGKMPAGGLKELEQSIKTRLLLLASDTIWPKRAAKITYIYLRTGQSFTIERTNEIISAAKAEYKSICENIRQRKFDAKKGPLCAWCDYYTICPAWKTKPNELALEPIEKLRQRLRLSYSKMSLFINCPRAYKKLYIDKAEAAPQPFFSFGTTIHETLERIYDPKSAITKPSLNELLQIYDEVRQKHREGYNSAEIEEKYRLDGVRQLTMYYNRFIKGADFAKAYAIEEYFEIPCGKNALITGYIDRIDDLKNETYEILDYKTEPVMRSQTETDQDQQLSIYYMACKELFKLKISKLSLLMLEFDTKIETVRGQKDIEETKELIDKTALEILSETEYLPKKNKYCKSCEYLFNCPLKEDIENDSSIVSMKKY